MMAAVKRPPHHSRCWAGAGQARVPDHDLLLPSLLSPSRPFTLHAMASAVASLQASLARLSLGGRRQQAQRQPFVSNATAQKTMMKGNAFQVEVRLIFAWPATRACRWTRAPSRR